MQYLVCALFFKARTFQNDQNYELRRQNLYTGKFFLAILQNIEYFILKWREFLKCTIHIGSML
jgi:hypothetical protein